MTSGLSAVISQASEQTETPRLGVSLSGLKQASMKHMREHLERYQQIVIQISKDIWLSSTFFKTSCKDALIGNFWDNITDNQQLVVADTDTSR